MFRRLFNFSFERFEKLETQSSFLNCPVSQISQNSLNKKLNENKFSLKKLVSIGSTADETRGELQHSDVMPTDGVLRRKEGHGG